MKKKQLPYTGSRKGYARLIDDMSQTSATKEQPSRVAVWTRAHKKKNGESVSIAAGEAIENMEEHQKELPLSSKTNVKDDAISKVLGPEKSGRVRAYGGGVTFTKLAIVSERDEIIIRLEKECRELKEQLAAQQGLINTLLKNQGSACQIEKQSNASIPFSMKSVNTNSQSKECKIMDWNGSGDIVAEGRWSSSDPTALVHHIPIGHGAVRVWVDVERKPKAILWRPTSEMLNIEDAIGSIVAWPLDKIIRTSRDI